MEALLALNHRRTKELTYNYVDRVRLAEHSLQQDYKCPTRGSGWRHNNKSISHLDLATSCHSTAFGPSHWPHNRQLHHSRSLDYAHLSDRCKDPLDIAEFYWRLDPEGDALYEDEYEDELPDEEETLITRYNGEQRQEPPYRDYNYAEGNYHTTFANNSQHLQPPHLHHNSGGGGVGSGAATSAATAAATLQAFDFGSESCSLRRSRSLAVIREETFSDLQITTANNSRRSQLIPRARIVNRDFIRERERLICGDSGGGSSIGIGASKHHHHHHHHASGTGSCNNNTNACDELGLSLVEQKVQHNNSINVASSELGELHPQPQHIHAHSHANSHQHRHHHHHTSGNANENLQSHHTHPHPHPQSPTVVQQPQQYSIQQHRQPHQSREADDYYDNLKRLDALTLGLVEQLHPWHNEKSDLESLNSDYFKNSLHQSHELQQQLDFEALEEAVSFLASEKPRIYQSHRQQRALSSSQQKVHNAADSYQENSQSSVFPETTTSNSDDQTDSPSLSEQEYDLKKIEKIYKKTAELGGDEEGYELISLTTTTHTRIETTEDEEEEEQSNRAACTEQDTDDFGCSATAENFNDASEHTNGVLKRSRALSENLEKLIAYDSVYLSSEESSESTLIDDNHCEAYEHTTHVTAKVAEDSGETSTLLHFSIEDIIYEPHPKEQYSGDSRVQGIGADTEIATATIFAETETAEIATQTTKEKQLVSVVETVNTKIESIPLIVTALVNGEQPSRTLESTTLYTQILKVGHNEPSTCTTTNISTPTSTTAAQTSARALVTATSAASAPGVVKPTAHSSCLATQPTVGITSSAASKPKILSVVEKRKWKRYNDSTTAHTTGTSAGNEVSSIQPRGSDLEPLASSASPPTDYPHSTLKRQSTTDSLTYLPFQTNLSGNQYHSLPDVNIGQSLKVSECIDAKLRSSYNVHNTELDECYLREAGVNATTTSTTTKTTLLLENSNKCKLKQQCEEVVTSEEIYDSIKRFGRAHQKARKKEYQELHEVQVEKEKKREVKEKLVKTHETVEEALKVNEQTTTTTTITTTTSTTYQDSLGEEIVEQPAELENKAVTEEIENEKSSLAEENCYIERNTSDDTDSNLTASGSLDNSTSEYQEQPKDAPDVEVENFSKLIERRAKEIKAQARKKTLGTGELKNLKYSANVQHSDTISKESLLQPTSDYRVSTPASQFRIIVTDAHNNIVEEEAIAKEDSLNSIDKDEATKKYQQLNLLADVTIRRQEKREKTAKDKSTIVSTHTRVASLKRVPSKPKRQQHSAHHAHCCQQQHKNNSNKGKNNSTNNKNAAYSLGNSGTVSEQVKGTGNANERSDSNNYCELSIKSKERRVLSTQIYKARPIKVLTANDSFRRRSTEGAVTAAGSKMSRPQILHVVDNKRRADILGNGKSVNNSSTRGGGINYNKAKRVEGSQIESEYLKKVDAVRNYWSKLAKDEDEQQQECAAEGKQVEVGQVQKASLDMHTLMENGNELTNGGRAEDVQPKQTQQPQQPQPEPRHFILGAQPQDQTQSQAQRTFQNQPSKPLKPSASGHQDDYCSFMPSIEIVELAGDKKATMVSAVPPDSTDDSALANDANGEPQFDHIRYKVLKSQQLLRNNMLPRSKKEAQFDGLIQYLQEYSFQELLANNNVVIVEPVRTKIERPLTTITNAAATAVAMQKLGQRTIEASANAKASNQLVNNGDSKVGQQAKLDMSVNAKMQPKAAACNAEKGGAGAGGRSGGNVNAAGGGGGGIKRHFFYQPVRVNRELYEEELPNPDIVRNVRKFFEENVLPTPRGGMQLQHTPPDEETFVERSAATQLPSPRARRARKYRYLTIDTSYGHMPHQHPQHQQSQTQLPAQQAPKDASPTSRKWDTASQSSGISSGDLSSPCECNETDITACTAEKQEAVCEEVLKGVHVQAVVQRHNNRNMRSATSPQIESTVGGGESDYNGHLLRPRPRPRSAIRSGEDSTYRVTDIYEQHATQQKSRNFAREDEKSRMGDAETSDDEDTNDEDLDDDAYESHYVSKDVLEKIRECGSTVTYYGGQVLQSTSPDLLHYGSAYNGAISSSSNPNHTQSNDDANTNTMTLTRRRVRQIESCNAGECALPQSTRQKLPQQHEDYNDNTNMGSSAEGADDNRESSLAHFGIKFKLVKSNSCSSRLELAGTGVEVVDTGADDAEVVKRMVHHFECTKQRQVVDKEEPLTINNQMPARRALAGGQQVPSGAVGEVKQVTVNNHINVPMTTYILDDGKPANEIRDHADNKSDMVGEKIYQSSAMDIRLSNADPRKSQECAVDSAGGDGNGSLKVWRNKNVDLAYTMAKKPIDGKTAQATITPRQKQCETLQPLTPTSSAIVASVNRILAPNKPLKGRSADNAVSDSNEGSDALEKINLINVGEKQQQQQLSVENCQMSNEAQRPTATQIKTQSATTTPILAPRSTRLPAQIVVPVEIHRAEQQTPEPHGRASVASSRGSSVTTVITTSSTSVLDKSVVRHYVANDKSLFEKRKYDDIEFEEFEIYDPTKDFEKLIENEKRREEAKRGGLQQEQPASGILSAMNDASNADARYAEEDDEEEDGRKSKHGSDCYEYDSLEDKL